MISVLISVYAGETAENLRGAIHSTYNSLSLLDNQLEREIVLVKDGPLTADLDILIRNLGDQFGTIFKVVTLCQNVGLGAALNEGLKICSFELVARMDTDDICLPERFSKQIQYMESSPEVVASSGIVEEWDSGFEKLISKRVLPLSGKTLIDYSKKRSPLNHPAVIFRKSVILKLGGYPELRKAQDYGLWSKLLVAGYEIGNLDEVLVQMRAGDDLLNRRGINYLKSEVDLIKYQYGVGFLNMQQFITNICIRFILRASPQFIQKAMYKFLR